MARPKKAKDDLSQIVNPGHIELAGADEEAVATLAPGSQAEMRSRIADLEKKLAEATHGRSDAEKRLLDQALAQGSLLQTSIQEIEVPGEFAEMPICKGYEVVSYRDDGRPIRKPIFEQQKVPMFFYKIDLPPSGGDNIGINGQKWYHGAVVKVDLHLLRTMKDIVYRCWKHDQDIHGTGNENAYRRQQRPHLSARGM